MRIIFASNYLSNSGYANQARLIVPQIIAAGHEVEVLPLAANYIDRITVAPDGVKLLPLAQHPLGYDIIKYHYVKGNFDAVITFTDLFGLDPAAFEGINWYPLAPVDTSTLNTAQMATLRACNFPIAISKFGQALIKDQTGIEAHYLPMMVDTDFWQPGNKADARAALGLEQDRIIFTFVGVNREVPSRKGIPELLLAWAQLQGALPKNAYLNMHTAQHGGVDIVAMASQLGIPGGKLRVTDEAQYHTGLSDEAMLLMAQSSDVLIQPSRREGAGLPLLEYQACGIPVIASDAHAQTEYNKGNFRISGKQVWSALGAWEFQPSVNSIKEQIMDTVGLVGKPELLEFMGGHLRSDTMESHSVTAVTEDHLQPILQAISMDVLSKEK